MARTKAADKRRGPGPLNIALAVVTAAALITAAVTELRELRKPADQRTWHGTVWGFLPYELRVPTLERVRATMWSPDDPILVPRLFGIGWTINYGGVVKRITDRAGRSDTRTG